MPKYASLEDYLATLNEEALNLYARLKQFVMSLDDEIEERLFAGQVAFYKEATLSKTFHESPVIVMSFYNDHVNVFAMANLKYKAVLPEYKFTSKGTMQIYYHQRLNHTHLAPLFIESLSGKTG